MIVATRIPKTDKPVPTGLLLIGDQQAGYFIAQDDSIELAQALEDYLNGVRGGLTASTIHSFLRNLKDARPVHLQSE